MPGRRERRGRLSHASKRVCRTAECRLRTYFTGVIRTHPIVGAASRDGPSFVARRRVGPLGQRGRRLRRTSGAK